MGLGEIPKSGNRVEPIAESIYAECKAIGLTLEEFHTLTQLLGCKYEEIRKERSKKMLNELL